MPSFAWNCLLRNNENDEIFDFIRSLLSGGEQYIVRKWNNVKKLNAKKEEYAITMCEKL